jgi:hypothetical protein
MVCFAAFIVLVLISAPVAVLSVIGKYNKNVARLVAPYSAMFKKSWYCVGRRLTLRKCDSSFKDEIKISLLKRVVVTRPKLVKPLSVTIEVLSILIVIIAIWSLLAATKAGLMLYVYGTCDLSNPSNCLFSSPASYALAREQPGLFESLATGQLPQYYATWFREFGEVIAAVPDRFLSGGQGGYPD